MRTRYWSIRSKIVALVAVPLVALLALWVFATVLTVGPAINLLSAQTLLDTVGRPGEVLVGELQKERRLSVVHIAGDDEQISAELAAQRAATDRAAAAFRGSAAGSDAQDAASGALRTRIAQILTDLSGLTPNRGQIDRRELDVRATQNVFNQMVDAGFQMFAATASFGDETVDRQVRALTTVGRGQEYLSRADALLAGAAEEGTFDEIVREDLIRAIVTSRFLLAEGIADLPSADRATFQQLSNSEAFTALRGYQEELLSDGQAGVAPPVTLTVWQPAYDTSAQQLRAFELNATDALAERATPVATRVIVRLAVAGLLGLAALIISVVVAVRVGRSIAGRLRRLRAEALDLAGDRLPSVVRRLQRGETVDVRVETPPLEYGQDEIGQVGRAFNEVQLTAVRSAVEEAAVRRGLNEVFLNIARRSQTLLHRQLALLDRMERRETEPDELEDLYRVDHLATRMRRHAEDLVILTGAVPGRGWRQPVPMIDVVRGAISEVEDYKRIDITTISESAVIGRAVGDVIHLLAELMENATSFSPPQTRVTVTGQILPNGYAIEVDDSGLGMSQETLDDANRKMAEPPDFDPSDSARLGLFVVARLAHRHGVKVSLRPSRHSGVTAVVLIPAELTTAAPPPPALSPLPASSTTDPGSTSEPVAGLRAWEPAGDGAEDPGRALPAELRWQDPDATMPVPTQAGIPRPRPASEPLTSGGPAPGSVADGLSPEGLVRRRRPPRNRKADSSAIRPSAGSQEKIDAGPAEPAPEPASRPETTREGLPIRVRQASLAPQLRERAPEEEDSQPLRTPEEVRTMMSALQRGTTRGRLAAAGVDADATTPASEHAIDPAATVNLPVIRDEKDA
jgi:signal transduction histidine kinase